MLVLDDLILAVEVKGGQVSCRDGRVDVQRPRRPPPDVARRTVQAGADRHVSPCATGSGSASASAIDDVAFGFLVITPDVDLASSFEWDDETYCGRGPFNRGIDKAVDRARKYWRGKQPGKLPIGKELQRTADPGPAPVVRPLAAA